MLLLTCVFAGCAWLCVVTISSPAGSEPAVHPVLYFSMDTDDVTQTSARTDEQHPWLEYSVWQAGPGVGADLHSGSTSTVAPR